MDAEFRLALSDVRSRGAAAANDWQWVGAAATGTLRVYLVATGALFVATLLAVRAFDQRARSLAICATVVSGLALYPAWRLLPLGGLDPKLVESFYRPLLAGALVLAIRARGVRVPRTLVRILFGLSAAAIGLTFAMTSAAGTFGVAAVQVATDGLLTLLLYLTWRWCERASLSVSSQTLDGASRHRPSVRRTRLS